MARTINPLDFINHIDREFDGLIGKLVDTAKSAKQTSAGSWTPPMSVTESADGFEVTIDAPGMQNDAFDLEFQDGVLRITGERTCAASDDVKWHQSERRFGSFERKVRLTEDVALARLDAEYRDGVLRIVLPKKEAAKPTKIAVR